jgi:small GTP-binding protein
MEKEKEQLLMKVTLVGQEKVGKTAIMMRISQDSFSEEYRATIGVEFCTKLTSMPEVDIKLQLWDTAGQERFRSLAAAYYKGSGVIIMVYDVTKRESLKFVEAIYHDIPEGTARFILVGTKTDLKDSREVSTAEGRDLADQLGVDGFFEVSSKDNEQIKELIEKVNRIGVKKYFELENATPGKETKENQ